MSNIMKIIDYLEKLSSVANHFDVDDMHKFVSLGCLEIISWRPLAKILSALRFPVTGAYCCSTFNIFFDVGLGFLCDKELLEPLLLLFSGFL